MRDWIEDVADSGGDLLFLALLWSPVVVFVVAMVVAALR